MKVEYLGAQFSQIIIIHYIGFVDPEDEDAVGAVAGFNAMDILKSYELPGSGTDDILMLAETSNINIPGFWMFQINEEEIES